MDKKEIIFIVGAGRSGSTILDMLLGGAENAISTGELIRIFDKGSQHNICTCNNELQYCQIWGEIVTGLRRGSSTKIRSNSFLKLFDFWNIIFSYRFNKTVKNRSYVKNIQENVKVIEELFCKSKADVVIDSSKDLLRALMIEKELQDKYSFNYIFLTRDSIENAVSRTKKYYYLEKEGQRIRIEKPSSLVLTFPKAIFSWMFINLKCLLLLKVLRKPFYHLTFTKLISDPKSFISNFKEKSRLKLNNELLSFENREYHLINGNPSRFNAKGIEAKFGKKKPRLGFKERMIFHLTGASILNNILKS